MGDCPRFAKNPFWSKNYYHLHQQHKPSVITQLPHVPPVLTSHVLILLPSMPCHPDTLALVNSYLTIEIQLKVPSSEKPSHPTCGRRKLLLPDVKAAFRERALEADPAWLHRTSCVTWSLHFLL